MQPVAVSKMDVAFGRIKGLMPPTDILERRASGWGADLFSRLFYSGGKFDLKAKPGVDRAAAFAHIRAIMGSFEPKHEHKESACAYLFELWFEAPDFAPSPTSTAGRK